MSLYPCFIDFQASGLENDAYPIEVSWNLPSGIVRSFLIRPSPSWNYWSKRAEGVHGISREELLADGVSAAEICAMMCSDLDGQEVYADGGLLDCQWLALLLEAGGCSQPTFRLWDCSPDLFFPDLSLQKKADLQEEAWKLAGHRHRAGNNVRWLVEWLRLGREAGYQDNVPGPHK